MFTKVEKEVLIEMLDQLSDRFSSDGCNVYDLENTPENKEFLVAVAENDDEPDEWEEEIAEMKTSTKKRIYALGGNSSIVHYFINKLEHE